MYNIEGLIESLTEDKNHMDERSEALKAERLAELFVLEDFSPVYETADRIRRKNKGDTVHLRAIIEFSNMCGRNCLYCGLRKENSSLKRFRMSKEETEETAKEAVDAGYRTIVLQSGEVRECSVEALGELVGNIKKLTLHDGSHPAVTLSCGEMSREDYAFLKDSGADRYLLKHETADEALYGSLHPEGSLRERIGCLESLKELGYVTGSGFMTGLPGQTPKMLAEDLLLLKRLGCHMAGIGPFIPNPGTPLGKCDPGKAETARRAVALARILLPEADIPVTTALSAVSGAKEGRTGPEGEDPFAFGANVVMKKATPDKYGKYYEIYPMKTSKTRIREDRQELEKLIRSFGRKPL